MTEPNIFYWRSALRSSPTLSIKVVKILMYVSEVMSCAMSKLWQLLIWSRPWWRSCTLFMNTPNSLLSQVWRSGDAKLIVSELWAFYKGWLMIWTGSLSADATRSLGVISLIFVIAEIIWYFLYNSRQWALLGPDWSLISIQAIRIN